MNNTGAPDCAPVDDEECSDDETHITGRPFSAARPLSRTPCKDPPHRSVLHFKHSLPKRQGKPGRAQTFSVVIPFRSSGWPHPLDPLLPTALRAVGRRDKNAGASRAPKAPGSPLPPMGTLSPEPVRRRLPVVRDEKRTQAAAGLRRADNPKLLQPVDQAGRFRVADAQLPLKQGR